MNNFVLIKEQMRHCNCFCLSVFAEHSLFVRAFRLKMEPHSISVDEDLYNAAKEVQDEMNSNSEGLLDPELFQQFAIVDRGAEFEMLYGMVVGR
ncbi:hypothetical protein T459_07308 [Capsicum annuum]|uniref:Possible tRNA binding domain-containing protein n=1 Tax=Capsicum annuum TaxID=4072 RepID=A0A2G2ZTA7_CAPAN|nr:hypothetical protein T459_07308 [Capsicum annuum]